MEEKQKTFLEELQSLDESIKSRVLIITTVLVMAIVVYVWLGYFNGLVAAVSPAPTVDGQSQPISGESGFWQGLKNDMAGIEATLRGPGQYTIQPSK